MNLQGHYRYPSRRSVVFGSRGMVCTASQLAAQAGLSMLKKGGNAVDAALACAICLTVVEPVSNGLGSDAFAIVWMKDRLYGLNSSGWSPAGLTAEEVRRRGYKNMPMRGWLPVTVPGAPAAWRTLSRQFGRLPFRDLFEPAIDYARNGYPVSPFVAGEWAKEEAELRAYEKEDAFSGWFETFLSRGRAPKAGEMVYLPDHARSLEGIAETEAAAFYEGRLAEEMERFARATGGFLRKEDLAQWHNLWADPISVRYRGYDVYELPPNGHGLVPLMALQILKQFSFGERDSLETLHRQFEAMKLAYADGMTYITDPEYMKAEVSALLSEEYARKRAGEIGETAKDPQAGDPYAGGTVYLCAADGEGNMISYIQSNYNHFGSGIVIPGTGIALQDRGANFSLDPHHVNCLAPRKRTYHTIIPGFLMKDGQPVGPFGVMGGFMQPQGHVQVMMNMIDFDMNPQEALDAPRWQWVGGKKFMVENTMDPSLVEGLREKGHEIEVSDDLQGFGRGEIIRRNEEGVLMGATEPRADGTAAAW